MWILSQDRKLLINVNTINYNDTNNCICSDEYVLGRYKSVVQVEEIFQLLITRLRKARSVIENIRGDYIVHNYVPEVFEMPQEEE